MSRTRSIIVGLLAFSLYLLLNLDLIQRDLIELDNAWLCGLGFATLLSAWALEGQGLAVRLFWVLLAPVLGSMTGYGVPILADYLLSGYLQSGTLQQWTRMAAIEPYLPARLWMLSVLLLFLSIANHLSLSLRNRMISEARRP